MQRLIYLSWPAQEITGGIKMIFRHVEALREAGWDACVATQDGQPPSWFETTAPVLQLTDLVADSDVLVFPENEPWLLERFALWKNRKVVFCQNQFQVHRGLGGRLDYAAYGARDLICPGQHVLAFCRRRFPLQTLHFVPYPLDRQLFVPHTPKRLQIAFAPRKRPLEAGFIQDLFRAENLSFRDVPWILLADRTEKELAHILGESALYLSLSRFESFGLSTLEALASGCIVAGFTGFGCRDYTNASNGFWAAEDDCVECAQLLAQAARLLTEGGARYQAMLEGAMSTAASYSPERFRERLLQCWRTILQGTSSPGTR